MTYAEWAKKWNVPAVGYVGDGWAPLLDRLMEDLAKVGPMGPIAQIKEKFGGLRFYTVSSSAEHNDLIWAAEAASYTICERCGSPGSLDQTRQWVKTLCEPCKEVDKR